jgi:hypothetical protein
MTFGMGLMVIVLRLADEIITMESFAPISKYV